MGNMGEHSSLEAALDLVPALDDSFVAAGG